MPPSLRFLLTATALIGLAACDSNNSGSTRGSSHGAASHGDHGSHDFDANLHRLRKGMSRSQVNEIMQSRGDVLERADSGNGQLEIVRYYRTTGSSYARALKRNYTFGLAGREGASYAVVTFRNGRLSHIAPR
jgi:hypothetical protein